MINIYGEINTMFYAFCTVSPLILVTIQWVKYHYHPFKHEEYKA